jgi:2-polyprenyl-3-methyl-5-hydroxy-6-metoxy-1,4-benzoquinol methylase
MAESVDPEGAHIGALRRLVELANQEVLEVGCGDGRLTVEIARDAAHVVAFDPDADAVGRATRSLPAALADIVDYRAASAKTIELTPHSFDLVFFSWSL